MKYFSQHEFTTHKNTLMLFVLVGSLFMAVGVAQGADSVPYTPLVNLPGLTGTGPRSLPDFINTVYKVLIGLGALIAFFKIVLAGIKWSYSGIVTEKSEAKADIRGALLGLAILLSFILLSVINLDLTRLDVFRRAPPVNLTTPQGTSAGGTTGGTTSGFDGLTEISTDCTGTREECRSTCISNGGNLAPSLTPGQLDRCVVQANPQTFTCPAGKTLKQCVGGSWSCDCPSTSTGATNSSSATAIPATCTGTAYKRNQQCPLGKVAVPTTGGYYCGG